MGIDRTMFNVLMVRGSPRGGEAPHHDLTTGHLTAASGQHCEENSLTRQPGQVCLKKGQAVWIIENGLRWQTGRTGE